MLCPGQVPVRPEHDSIPLWPAAPILPQVREPRACPVSQPTLLIGSQPIS